MAFNPDYLIKMGDVREVIRDELAGKITTVELTQILFELKKHAFPEQTEAKTDDLWITGGTVWREDMRPKPEAPRNLTRLLERDKQDLELAFSSLHAIHVRHSRDQHSHDCPKCPAADQAFCAYNTTKVMCEAAGIDVDSIAIWPKTEPTAEHAATMRAQ